MHAFVVADCRVDIKLERNLVIFCCFTATAYILL